MLHTAGELRRYLGGEPVIDELGRPVLNFDGSFFLHQAGQVVLPDRRDLVFVPDAKEFTYNPAGLTIDLDSEGTLRWNPTHAINFTRSGTVTDPLDPTKTITLAPDRVVAVVVRSGVGIFALYEGANGFTFTPGTGVLTITAAAAALIPAGATLEVTLALLDTFAAGDAKQWFGDEQVGEGDAVIVKSGDNFTLAFAEDGETVLTYSASACGASPAPNTVCWLDSKGQRIVHKRGEPVFDDPTTTGVFVQQFYAGGEVKRYLGNEPTVYFGGERTFYTAIDPKSTNTSVQRLSFDGPEGDILFTEATFPNGSGVTAAANNIALDISLDSGNNLFTIVDTQEGTTRLTTGDGADRIAVRRIDGRTEIRTGDDGADKIYVGSGAGLWSTTGLFQNVLGHGNLINAVLYVDGGTGSSFVDEVDVDDTSDLANDHSILTLDHLTGLFGQPARSSTTSSSSSTSTSATRPPATSSRSRARTTPRTAPA